MSDVEQGVGACSEREDGLGHVWAGIGPNGGPSNPCRFCGTSGREFFAAACAARAALFRNPNFKMPDSAKGIKPKERSS